MCMRMRIWVCACVRVHATVSARLLGWRVEHREGRRGGGDGGGVGAAERRRAVGTVHAHEVMDEGARRGGAEGAVVVEERDECGEDRSLEAR